MIKIHTKKDVLQSNHNNQRYGLLTKLLSRNIDPILRLLLVIPLLILMFLNKPVHYPEKVTAYSNKDELYELHASSIESIVVTAVNNFFDENNDDNDDDDELSSIYGNGSYYELLRDKSTSQGKAFEWLVNESSSSSLADDNPTLLQRYALAVIYFSMGGNRGKYLDQISLENNNNNAGEKDQEEDLVFSNEIDDTEDNWSNSVSFKWTTHGSLQFLSEKHECMWNERIHKTLFGVKCCDDSVINRIGIGDTEGCKNGGREVKELFLAELRLEGTLPREIGFLTQLKVLELQDNALEGSIPKSLGKLQNLRYLGLGSNNFVGTLHENIGSLTMLETAYFNYNKLDGGSQTIPNSLCLLKQQPNRHLYSLWTDCNRENDPVICDCCDVCCDGKSIPTLPLDRSVRSCEPIGALSSKEESDIDDDDNNTPIIKREKRRKQSKEEHQHQSEEWFSLTWFKPSR